MLLMDTATNNDYNQKTPAGQNTIDPKNASSLWTKTLSGLSNDLSAAVLKTWFKNSYLQINTKEEKAEAVVYCLNNFCKEQIDRRYKEKIADTLSKIAGQKVSVNLAVGSLDLQPAKQSRNNHQSFNNSAGPLFELPSFSPPASKTTSSKLTFENLVVGESNRLAYAAAKAVSENPGQNYNPLFIYGNVGVGKTHLIHAIGSEVWDKNPQSKVVYVTCEKFTNEFIESVQSHSPKSFREKYRKVDVLLLDDVQFLSGREATQEEFFHTFNELHINNKQIVLTSDRHPSEIGKLEDRLVSRFLGGLTVDVGQPNFEMRLGILRSKAKQLKIAVDDKVLDAIATKITSNVRELEGSLIALHSKANLLGENLNLDFVKNNLARNEKVNATPKQVLNEVCKFYKLTKGDILGNSRKKNVVWPRQVVMYFLRNKLNLALILIGDFLSGKDHTTIMYGVSRVEEQIKSDSQKMQEIKLIESRVFENAI